MAPKVLYRVCYSASNPSPFQASLLTICPAILPAYTRRKVRFCDYPAIVPSSPGSSVRGTYVRGLTDGDIWRLDIFEGDQYSREKVKIKVLIEAGNEAGKGNVEGEEVEVETYVWAVEEEFLEEGEWDFGEFTREKMKRWIGDDKEYQGELRPSIRGTFIGQNAGG